MRFKNELEAMYGTEPEVGPDFDLAKAIEWYNFVPKKEEKKSWFLQYLQDSNKVEEAKLISILPDGAFITAGSLARMHSRGVEDCSLIERLTQLEVDLLAEGKEAAATASGEAEKKAAGKAAAYKRELTTAICEIQIVIDGFLETKSSKFDMATWITSNRIKPDIQEEIRKKFSKLLAEVELSNSDADLAEGYSFLTKNERMKFLALLTDIVATTVQKVGSRKPRKKKNISPEKKVKRLNYCKNFDELKINSIDPTQIIGATSLWVYNTKYRVLTNYASETGLDVKGSTLLNIDSSETRAKKLRKPEVTIPEVLTGGKVQLRKIFDNLSTKDANFNGRINKETVLLRVAK